MVWVSEICKRLRWCSGDEVGAAGLNAGLLVGGPLRRATPTRRASKLGYTGKLGASRWRQGVGVGVSGAVRGTVAVEELRVPYDA